MVIATTDIQAAPLEVTRPPASETLTVPVGQPVRVAFDTAGAEMAVEDGDLIVRFPDGAVIVFQEIGALVEAPPPMPLQTAQLGQWQPWDNGPREATQQAARPASEERGAPEELSLDPEELQALLNIQPAAGAPAEPDEAGQPQDGGSATFQTPDLAELNGLNGLGLLDGEDAPGQGLPETIAVTPPVDIPTQASPQAEREMPEASGGETPPETPENALPSAGQGSGGSTNENGDPGEDGDSGEGGSAPTPPQAQPPASETPQTPEPSNDGDGQETSPPEGSPPEGTPPAGDPPVQDPPEQDPPVQDPPVQDPDTGQSPQPVGQGGFQEGMGPGNGNGNNGNPGNGGGNVNGSGTGSGNQGQANGPNTGGETQGYGQGLVEEGGQEAALTDAMLTLTEPGQVITGFDIAAPEAGGDVLDLSQVIGGLDPGSLSFSLSRDGNHTDIAVQVSTSDDEPPTTLAILDGASLTDGGVSVTVNPSFDAADALADNLVLVTSSSGV